MYKHTPGPWNAEFSSGRDLWRVERFDAETDREILICEIDEFRINDEQQKANARLIAAAPDLLAALDQAKVALTAQEWRFGHRAACNMRSETLDDAVKGCNCDLRDIVAAVAAADAAIAKATGES